MTSVLQRIVNALQEGDGAAHFFDSGQLPGHVSQAIWRGTDIGQADQTVIPTGFDALNVELPGGGWPCNSLTELLQPQPSLCEWRLLSPSLASLVAGGGHILLVGPPKRPHAPGLLKLGITDKQIVWIAADTPAERLWTTEQLIKANPRGGAILAWLPQARPEQLRRLQVHAQACECPIFLFRPDAVQLDASPAPLRVLASLGEDWGLNVQIIKRKGTPMEGHLVLSSIPGTLATVFTPRLLRPSQLIAKVEESNVYALGSVVNRRRLRAVCAH